MSVDTTGYQANPWRGRFNAGFFRAMEGYLDWHLRPRKAEVFADLPDEVVELGSGVGANLRYMPPGSRVIAVEPNPHMHAGLRRQAQRRGIEVDIRDVVGERVDLPDGSADTIISSLVLCTVTDPARVLAEVHRVLQPGGRFCFVEHVAAAEGTFTRRVQRAVRRPWRWVFEGCSCERDLAATIQAAGFKHVTIQPYRIHSPFLPFNTQIAGHATR